MRFRKTILAATNLVALVFSSSAWCYEPTTHQILTQLAADKSRIYTDAGLMSGLGFTPGDQFSSIDLIGNTTSQVGDARTIMGLGAILEDQSHTNTCLADWQRPFNHFFDPQHSGRGLQVPVAGTIGHPSPTWALEDQGEVTTILVPCQAIGGLPQLFSYQNAEQDLFTALTASTEANRKLAMSRVLQKLGHIVHHIQDMAQPQHTRNDTHSPIDPPEKPWFEHYTEMRVNTRIAAIVNANAYTIPVFARARDYWVTSGASGPQYRGMAEFTSNNYVTQGTGFASNGSTVLPNPSFPFPNGTGKTITQQVIPIAPRVGSPIVIPMSVVTGSVTDTRGPNNVPVTYTGKVLATASITDKFLNDHGHTRLYTVSSAVFEDQYPILLPRAVAFSAGLINHFFAGNVSLRRTTNNNGWFIDNLGADALNGSFQLLYETVSGQRILVPNSAWVGTLQPNQGTPVRPEPPLTAVKLIAVFSGTIGTETMVRTAGKVINYLPPPIPCGEPVSAEGRSEIRTVVQEMGTQSGTVTAEFEAYAIPDSYEIREVRADGSLGNTLVTTGGQVSGWHTWTWQHNPQQSGSTKVRVQVVGNTNPDTQWTTTVSCPGQSLDNGDRPEPRISINFVKGGVQGTGCPTGHVDVFLDGSKVGTLNYDAFNNGSSFSTQVTVGTRHGFSLTYVNTSNGSPGGQCLGDGSIRWTDRAGTHLLPGNSGIISIQ